MELFSLHFHLTSAVGKLQQGRDSAQIIRLRFTEGKPKLFLQPGKETHSRNGKSRQDQMFSGVTYHQIKSLSLAEDNPV